MGLLEIERQYQELVKEFTSLLIQVENVCERLNKIEAKEVEDKERLQRWYARRSPTSGRVRVWDASNHLFSFPLHFSE